MTGTFIPNVMEYTDEEERMIEAAEEAAWRFSLCEHEDQEVVPNEGTYCRECSQQLDYRCPDFGRYSNPHIRRLMT
jgi:hypothetical protein